MSFEMITISVKVWNPLSKSYDSKDVDIEAERRDRESIDEFLERISSYVFSEKGLYSHIKIVPSVVVKNWKLIEADKNDKKPRKNR